MWILKNETLGESGTYEMNFLFNQGKFFIMDNHLCAAWCWIQKKTPKTKYGFFHIDRHYDLLDNFTPTVINQKRKFLTGTFSEFINVKFEESDFYPIARFDNYINIYRRLFPKAIKKYYFATHDDGVYLDEIKSYKVPIWELYNNLSYWINEPEIEKWILNIDLDYFFLDNSSTEFQFLTDEYIRLICEEIQRSMSKIEVITIALSPGFCGDWKQAFHVLNIFTEFFALDFNHEWEL